SFKQSNKFLLSERETEVLELLANGNSAKLIASKLRISITTVISHCECMKKKLGAKNSPELINKAWKLGLLTNSNS
ncbi:MAG TPA: LuxR C-terminal-related transcriptional regulator, partial [Ignavibacteriaceae bacterium]|nr:LuxR C-terminal-related transcriptional regulator [Ignavibacteriaceae bacterium]